MRFQPLGVILIAMTCGLCTAQEVCAAAPVASIHLTTVAAAIWPGAQAPGGGCPCDGDVNQDGVVNIIDILTVYTCVVGGTLPSGANCDLVDVNCDGVVDTCDMSRVYCHFVGRTDCCGGNAACGACCNDGLNFRTCEFVSEDTCSGVLFNGTYLGDGTECVPMPCECFTDADCDDGSVCTDDVCLAGNVCEHTPVANGTPCSDGEFCTAADTCVSGACVPAGPTNCDDGSPCTVDRCDEVQDVCVNTLVECNHNGVCEAPCETLANCPDDCACTATRDLSDRGLSYCPLAAKTIRIPLNVVPGTLAIGVEDVPPDGWTQIDNISDGGTYDAANRKLKWGPFFSPFPAELTYDVVAPDSATGVECFSGTVSVDGTNEPICGDACAEESCCEGTPADGQTTSCAACADCTCATCGDSRVELCEMIGYACAWQTGCNDDLSGMTRAAFLWKSGECYCWNDADQSFATTSCSAPAAPCCSDGGGGATAAAALSRDIPAPRRPVARSTVSAFRKGTGRVRFLNASVAVRAPEGTLAMALDMRIPAGWEVTTISDGGAWDEQSRKVKWGPFFEDLSRTVTVETRGTVRRLRTREFSGTVSLDGVNYPIVGK